MNIFLKSFAVNATKEEGEFYTPHDIVELIAAFIEPFDGTLYDPCCGSGGMFIQCAKYVEAKQGDITTVNVFGQEKEDSTFRLAKMNLAMRGISHHWVMVLFLLSIKINMPDLFLITSWQIRRSISNIGSPKMLLNKE